MIEMLWAVYLEVCLANQCAKQEVQRFDTQAQCEKMLKAYVEVPADGQWDTVEWQCRPLNSESL